MSESQEDELFSRLFALGKLIRARTGRSPTSLSFAQLETLHLVAQEKSPTMLQIAKHHRITAPSATALTDELVRAQYLSRSRSPTDRRQVHLHLTPLGKRVLRANIARRKKIIREILANLSTKDKEVFISILNKIVR